MVDINLLPEELGPKASIVKTAALVNNLVFSGLILFLILGVGGVALFTINSFEMGSIKSREETAKNSIKSLESSEQKFVLVKDRISKVETVWADSPLPVAQLEAVSTSLPSGTEFGDVNFTKSGLETSYLVTDSSSLPPLFTKLTTNFDPAKSLDLTSFGFNQKSGYSVNVKFNYK